MPPLLPLLISGSLAWADPGEGSQDAPVAPAGEDQRETAEEEASGDTDPSDGDTEPSASSPAEAEAPAAAPPAATPDSTLATSPPSEAPPLGQTPTDNDSAPAEVVSTPLDYSGPAAFPGFDAPGGLSLGAGEQITFGAFADTSFTVREDLPASGFSLGQVVLHSRAQLGQGFSVFGEATLNNSPTWQARVERLMVDWELSDHLKVSAGRMHLPITWWNSTFHHGVWLQTTASRPRAVSFGDAFLPNHYKGLRLSGLAPFLQDLGLRYEVGVSNGSDDDPAPDGVTIPHAGAAFATLAVEPRSAPFLRIGASTQYDVEQALDGEKRGARSLESGVHVAYTKERPEFVAEVIMIRHEDSLGSSGATGAAAGAKHTEEDTAEVDHSAHVGHAGMGTSGDVHLSGGGYVQLAWRLRAAEERFKPYARYELVSLHQHDASLSSLSDVNLVVAGLRTDLTHAVALKLEGAVNAVDPTQDWTAQAQLSAAW